MTERLDEWLARACVAAGMPPPPTPTANETVSVVLDLARDAAHNVMRPAAPVATFVLGLAIAQGASVDELRQVADRISKASETEVADVEAG